MPSKHVLATALARHKAPNEAVSATLVALAQPLLYLETPPGPLETLNDATIAALASGSSDPAAIAWIVSNTGLSMVNRLAHNYKADPDALAPLLLLLSKELKNSKDARDDRRVSDLLKRLGITRVLRMLPSLEFPVKSAARNFVNEHYKYASETSIDVLRAAASQDDEHLFRSALDKFPASLIHQNIGDLVAEMGAQRGIYLPAVLVRTSVVNDTVAEFLAELPNATVASIVKSWEGRPPRTYDKLDGQVLQKGEERFVFSSSSALVSVLSQVELARTFVARCVLPVDLPEHLEKVKALTGPSKDLAWTLATSWMLQYRDDREATLGALDHIVAAKQDSGPQSRLRDEVLVQEWPSDKHLEILQLCDQRQLVAALADNAIGDLETATVAAFADACQPRSLLAALLTEMLENRRYHQQRSNAQEIEERLHVLVDSLGEPGFTIAASSNSSYFSDRCRAQLGDDPEAWRTFLELAEKSHVSLGATFRAAKKLELI